MTSARSRAGHSVVDPMFPITYKFSEDSNQNVTLTLGGKGFEGASIPTKVIALTKEQMTLESPNGRQANYYPIQPE